MILLQLTFHSLLNRRFTTFLTVASMALSVALFFGVEKVRVGAKDSFSNTISQTDLIVGARTGPIQLLLYAVFHMGDATNNISYKSYEHFRSLPTVDWAIPYSLGDSHKGYRVVATNEDFYKHYHYRRDHGLEIVEGQIATGIFDVVLGAEVATRLHYKVREKIVLSHGISDGASLLDHADKPFRIVGILAKTSTAIDRSLYITLEGMEAIHIDWQNGAPPLPGQETPVEKITKENIKVDQITAFLLRNKSRMQSIYLQRDINEYKGEPLLAIIPGVTLSQLWQVMSYAEDGLRLITFFVIASGFLGMLIALYTSLNERRREMAILRALGARPLNILALLVLESSVLTVVGITLGVSFIYLLIWVCRPIVESQFGIFIPLNLPTSLEWVYMSAIVVLGTVTGLVPAWRAYKSALSDGLSIKV
jgi:putative ABC transport system permease protein